MLQTKNLTLVLQTCDEVRAMIDALPPEDRKQVSADWLAQLDASSSADPWVHGFSVVHRESNVSIGNAGFKGPPGADHAVEIAYGIHPDHQGRGYATEAAQALVAYAFGCEGVVLVRAHTLPEANASTRVLSKSGFKHVGEVVDPEDGLVWRWEIGKVLHGS